jgi:hypothetical protein
MPKTKKKEETLVAVDISLLFSLVGLCDGNHWLRRVLRKLSLFVPQKTFPLSLPQVSDALNLTKWSSATKIMGCI